MLVVTNLWPTPDRPTYGIMVKRQVDSMRQLGIVSDVLYVRGFVSPLAYLLGALRLLSWNLSARRRYRLVHAHGGESLLCARFYVRAPVLISFMGADLLGATLADGSLAREWRIRTRIMRQCSRLASATITKSAEMASVLPGRVRARNTVLPNGVDRVAFVPLPQSEARARLGWGDDERVVLFAGRARVPRKRLDLARRACAEAEHALGPVRLQVADGVDPAVMPLLMNAADCLLHPAASEGSPNVVKEALACNLPVIATPVGDIPLLLDGVAPSYVREPTVTALASALVDCFSQRRRSNGRERSEWLSQPQIGARLAELYERLDGRRPATRMPEPR